MKHPVILLVAAGIVLLAACKKGCHTPTDTIVGKWNVISDSSFAGVGSNNHSVSYVGQAGDYFKFEATGILYIKEGNVADTLHYTSNSNTAVIIQSFGVEIDGVPATSTITYLPQNTISIATPLESTPAGTFGRKVILKR